MISYIVKSTTNCLGQKSDIFFFFWSVHFHTLHIYSIMLVKLYPFYFQKQILESKAATHW